MAELLTLAKRISGNEAARLVMEVQLPVGELVEAIDGRHIVYGDMTVKEEALTLLAMSRTTPIATSELAESMDRRNPRSVKNTVGALWKEKLLHRGS